MKRYQRGVIKTMEKYDFNSLLQKTKQRFAVPLIGSDGIDRLLSELNLVCADAEKLIQRYDDSDRSLIVCGAGCQDCCVVNVSITLLEGIAIARFVRKFALDDLEQVRLKLDSLWSAVRGLDDDERLVMRRKCAFLDANGSCTIYPVRPLFCRSISSTDVSTCRAAVAGSVFGEIKPVLMNQFQLQMYKVLFSGVGSGLEQAELDGRSFQLSGLVRYLLNNPAKEVTLLREGTLKWDDLY